MRIGRLGIVFLNITIILMLFVGCSAETKKNVIFIPQMLDNGGYWTGISDSIEAEVEKAGYDYSLMGDEEWDSKKQAEVIKEAVKKDASVIILAPVGDTELFSALKEADNAGIPVILIDADIDRGLLASYNTKVTTYVGADNYDGGKQIAGKIADKLEKGSDIAILRGRADSVNGENRCDGFKDEIINRGMNVTSELATDWSEREGYVNTKLMLKANPDIKAIFAVNKSVCKGAEKAADELNISIITGTFDYDDEISKSINEGKVLCTFDQNNDGMAKSVVQVINKIYNGQKVESIETSEGKLITK